MILVNGFQVSVMTFPNGERKLSLPESAYKNAKDTHKVIWQYEDDGDFMLLNMVDDWLTHRMGDKDEVIECMILSMPYERMDRRENGNVFSLKVAIAMLPADWRFVVLSAHSDVTGEIFKYTRGNYNLVVDYMSEVIYFADDYIKEYATDATIVFPDRGALNRYGLDLPEESYFYGEKVRNFETGKINGLEIKFKKDNVVKKVEDMKGMDVVVMDDLSSYGGTFIKLAEELDKINVGKKFLILEKAESSMLKGELLIKYDGVFTTDLMMDIAYDPISTPNLHVLHKEEIIETIGDLIGWRER